MLKILFGIIILLMTLAAINLILRLIREDKFKNTSSAFGGAIFLAVYLLLLFSIISDLLNRNSDLVKYSLISIYFIFHLIICATICLIVFYSIAIVSNIFNLDNSINREENLLFEIIGEIKTKIPKLYTLLDRLNTIFNPFHFKGNNKKRNDAKTIKLIILISYLVSGVIMLSPITNYLSQNGINFEIGEIKRDYDLYKTVFVTSLIPFTINYIVSINSKK